MDADTLLTMIRQARALYKRPIGWKMGRAALHEIMSLQYANGPAAGVYLWRENYRHREPGHDTLFGLPIVVSDDVSPETVLLAVADD